jgi:hypothetical protein
MSNDTSITDSMKPQTLHEVVVTASAVRHKPGKDVYAVFDELLRGASNPLDMMDRLPGVSYDKHGQQPKCEKRQARAAAGGRLGKEATTT